MARKAVPSSVERYALDHNGYDLKYGPEEKIGVIVVDSFPALGTLTALRFLEWVQSNPDGVIALPTGKTPEYFIKEVLRFHHGWDQKEIQAELEAAGIDPGIPCQFKNLHFVQIDEFYPINPLQHNSFNYYVRKFYLEGFGLDPDKTQLIDCRSIGLPPGRTLEDIWPDDAVDLSLRYRIGRSKLEQIQKGVLERIDQWCIDYEQQIRALGGIGFFLGGIGPDGHIGFNVSGSDHYSTTRLTATNYETQAAAASDLGGIEISKKRLVITIGLATITFNPQGVALIMAAGEAKSRIVADSIQSVPDIHYPASVLQRLANARFYITSGAARYLGRRKCESLGRAEQVDAGQIQEAVINLSLRQEKRVLQLTPADVTTDPYAAAVIKKSNLTLTEITQQVAADLQQKIELGIKVHKKATFLHTEPHHDDLMLGYLPYIVRHIREHSTQHFFTTLTSGFTAVTNAFMLRQLEKLKSYIKTKSFQTLVDEEYFQTDNRAFRNRDMWQYLDGVAANSTSMRDAGEMRRLYRNLAEVFDEQDVNTLEDRIDELINYFETQYPGRKDLDYIQKIKGMCREWEADCLWGYFGWNAESVRHLRLGFYTGEIFTDEPTVGRDIPPILKLMEEVHPDIVGLVMDPEASGPDTHYKVLQALTEALRIYAEKNSSEIMVLGYRNVWHRFHPAEADLIVPVSLQMFSLQHSAFMNTFISQKEASFPSHEHDGPFSELAQKIQVQQYQMIKTCLGREFFYEHKSALIRATRGLVFLKQMSLEQLYSLSRELKKSTENR